MADNEIQEAVEEKVDQLLGLSGSMVQQEKNKIQIGAIERELNKIVYRIYGLTEDEIKLIENSN